MHSYKDLYKDISKRRAKVSVIGLGYVGLPLAIAFSEVADVIGFDIDEKKIVDLKSGIDSTTEFNSDVINNSKINFTSNQEDLKDSMFHIVAVPTPVHDNNMPDLNHLINASKMIGKNLRKGSIVVYESTVYPSVTEDVCIPILERESGTKCGVDFKIGYSPERVNPGDKFHTIKSTKKVVSAIDKDSLEIISLVYSLILESQPYKAESIKIAEAAKLIENAQRDINIAFMNEISIMLNNLNIDSKLVIEAASTKWNFIRFSPGLVGGHCIGVDPYYLTYLTEKNGFISPLVRTSREINENMSNYIVENIIRCLISSGIVVKGCKIGILGISFKENCSDIRNTKVIDIINKLKNYDIEVLVYDPIVDKNKVLNEYNIEVCEFNDINCVSSLIFTVAHDEFLKYDTSKLKKLFSSSHPPVIIDIKRIFNRKTAENQGFIYWGL